MTGPSGLTLLSRACLPVFFWWFFGLTDAFFFLTFLFLWSLFFLVFSFQHTHFLEHFFFFVFLLDFLGHVSVGEW
ncbi:hypothetical protein GGI42DRAFT_329167, partial [Trichoderma sp. SZMC 28013]